MPEAILRVAEFGYLGVDFFFVLSGFIIYYTTQNEQPSAGAFLRKRLLRIYVPYLPIGIAMVALYALVPALSAGEREWSLLASLTLLPAAGPTALSVAWSLQHEIVFYLLFAVILASGRVMAGLWIWMAAIVGLWIMGLNGERPLSIIFGLINLEFGMGVLAAKAVIEGWKVPKALVVSGAGLAVVGFAVLADREFSVLIGAAIALALVPICTADRAGHIRTAGWLVFMGNASYALYLIHNPLLSVTSRAAAQITDQWWLGMAAGVAASIAAAVAYHVLFERHALRWTTSRAISKPNETNVVAGAT